MEPKKKRETEGRKVYLNSKDKANAVTEKQIERNLDWIMEEGDPYGIFKEQRRDFLWKKTQTLKSVKREKKRFKCKKKRVASETRREDEMKETKSIENSPKNGLLWDEDRGWRRHIPK